MPRAVVIGGSSGIGLATARLARRHGCAVTVLSRNPERGDADVDAVSIDISDTAAVTAFFEGFGPFEYLVSAPSVHAVGSLSELDVDAAKLGFDVKLWGPLSAIKAGDVREAIVLVSGIASTMPWRDGRSVVTAAICGAVEAVVRSLAVDLAPVRVNALSPGLVDTPLYADMSPQARSELYDQYAAVLPAGRVGTAEETADGIWLLLTNGFLTGTTMYVDGGHRLVAP